MQICFSQLKYYFASAGFSSYALQFILLMHKKTQRNSYALASSSISDIPLTLQKKEIQAFNKYEAAQFKQNSSIYHTFNQSRSQAEESISLKFSTARPFYEQVAEDYYNERQMGERVNYNKQPKDHYTMQRVKQKKSPKKRLMIYSYSNIALFHKKIEKIFLDSKKRAFITLCRVKKEQKMHLLNNNKKNASFYSGETNNTSREDALYRVSFGHRKEDRYDLHQQSMLQGVNIIQAWLEYRLLLDKRKIFNSIFQYGNDRKKFSLQLSQSLKVDNTHNQNYFLTDYHHSNEVSLTQGLPQQIQESLVYTLEHNSELTRKQLTQSTLQKFPTLKKYSSNIKSYEKLTSHQIQNDTNKKNSPMYKLKDLSNSPEKEQINFASPFRLQMQSMKKIKINIQRLIDDPLQFELNMYQTQNKIDQHEQAVDLNEIKANISTYDQYQSFSMDLKKLSIDKGNKCQSQRAIENSAKHSDVSNYRMDHTVHNQEQGHQIIVNYNSQPVIYDQTVLRKHVPQSFNEKNTPAKFQKYYFANREVNPAITTPKFISEIQNEERPISSRNGQQKPINQLENDRIRIYAKPNLPQSTRQLIAVAPSRTSKLRANFLSPNLPNTPAFSPHAPPITISSEKRIYSPMIHTQRLYQNQLVHNQLPPHQHLIKAAPPRIVDQPLRYQRIDRSPEYQIQRQTVQSPRYQQQIKPAARYMQLPINGNQKQEIRYTMNKEQIPISPRQIGPNIAQNKIIVNRPSPKIIHKDLIASPKSINQMRPAQSKQKIQNNLKRQDYGLFQNNSQQKPQYAIISKIPSSQNYHLANVQRQYQLPQSQMKCFKLQTAPTQAPIMNMAQNSRQTALMMKYSPRVDDKVEKRPQSSTSSPKLFFNYKSNHQSHIDEEIVLNSNHFTKNSSSISRPKSMNSKLFVTLRKEL